MPQEHLKVLLIEHDPSFVRSVGDMLGQARDLSAEVLSATDLRHGLSALNGNRFDVVLMGDAKGEDMQWLKNAFDA